MKNYNETMTGYDKTLEKETAIANKAWICGTIASDLEFSHQSYSEDFYKTTVAVVRLSGNYDYVPVLISAFLLKRDPNLLKIGTYVEIIGQLRTYNTRDENQKIHLNLNLFATSINIYIGTDDDYEEVENANLIYLEGNICKAPTYRVTPFGRIISDAIVAVHRAYGKSDYIPCIAWGRAAEYLSTSQVGDKIQLYGRLQSREYFKRYSEDSDEGETRVAYEVSILRLKL